MIPTEAIILVGGLGTRLRAVVSDMPKPLAPVANRPFLHWLLDGLERQGISHVVLATGYMGDVIREALGERFEGMELDYAHEKTSLGTGGALWGALKQCREQRVFVLNGDTWLGQSLHLLAAEAPDADLVLSVRSVTDRSRYGSVRVEGNRVLGLQQFSL